jgi:hypothetical protein
LVIARFWYKLPPPFSACVAVVESPARKKAGGFANPLAVLETGVAVTQLVMDMIDAKSVVPDEKCILI